MARIGLREDLVASRYDGLASGPTQLYSFETQEGLPVDSTNPLLRELSPFTIRVVPPQIIESGVTVDVNQISRANTSGEGAQRAANAVRAIFGLNSVSGDGVARLNTLHRIVSAGQTVTNATSFTERAVLADSLTAADIAYQIERLLQTSPLTLLINPSEMSTSYTSVQNYGDRGRQGYIFERWGEGQVSISFSGSTGSFMAAAPPGSGAGALTEKTSTPTGLQAGNRRDSAAWQNFMALFQFYRNNGYIYDTLGGSEAHLFIGALAIDYDQFTYVGHIESFEYSHQESSPHRVEWSMEFIADKMFDNAQPPVTVQPMRSPQPNPSYPSSSTQSFVDRPSASSGGGSDDLLRLQGGEEFAQAPLDMFLPSHITSR
jgi:hypothetical protein